MSPERQRIVIAEACGWVKCACGDIHCGAWFAPNSNEPSLLPDYINDLNAMHQAENVLIDKGDSLMWLFVYYLSKIVCPELPFAHATAAQRAEAFLRAIGKWEDGE